MDIQEISEEIDKMVKGGRFRAKIDAFADAFSPLIKSHKGRELAERMSRVREETEGYPSLSKALAEAREEEDERPR